MSDIDVMRKLSPRRNTTEATDAAALGDEQLRHFGIDPASEFGAALAKITQNLYAAQADTEALWNLTLASMVQLDRTEKIVDEVGGDIAEAEIGAALDVADPEVSIRRHHGAEAQTERPAGGVGRRIARVPFALCTLVRAELAPRVIALGLRQVVCRRRVAVVGAR